MPRQIVPGRVYLVTRRCSQRQHLLLPTQYVTQTVLYCLGEAARRFGVTVFGWCVMSNHHHLVVRDNHGNLPDFLAHFHKNVAKALNAHWGRHENLWSNEQASFVHLVEEVDAFLKLVYTLCNPVRADLVDTAEEWPGATSFRLNLSGEALVIKRPVGYFRERGPMPDEVTLTAARLPGYTHLTQEEWATHLASAVREVETQQRRRRASLGLRVKGRKAVLAVDHRSCASSDEGRNTFRPSIACSNKKLRLETEAALAAFREAYRAALMQLRARARGVVFPYGTFRLKKYAVRCHEPLAA